MKRIFILFGIFSLTASCAIESFSGRDCENSPDGCVVIRWSPPRPVAVEGSTVASSKICRRGIPTDYYVPWRKSGSVPPDETTDTDSEELKANRIFSEVEQEKGWFKVLPEIRNNTPYYLIVDRVRFLVKSSGAGSQEEVEKSFESGGYCETSPLYIVDPGRTVQSREYSDFNQGNLVFYVDGLPLMKQGGANNTSNTLLYDTNIPTYTVEWRIEGDFFDYPSGEDVFRKIPKRFAKYGTFTTRSF